LGFEASTIILTRVDSYGTPYSSTSLVVCVSMNNIYVAWVPIQSDYLFICCYESKSAVGGLPLILHVIASGADAETT